jgi:lipopolysaccharide export system permease protein
MPIVVSVAFFLVYYVINMFGSKLAKEGTWNAFAGMWLSTFILAPLAAFLCYKANHDSNLLNTDWYYHRFQALKQLLLPLFSKLKKHRAKPE